MCDVLYTYRSAKLPLTAREVHMTVAEKQSNELRMARYLLLLAAGKPIKKRLSVPHEPKPRPIEMPTALEQEPFTDECLTPYEPNLLTNSSLSPRRLLPGTSNIGFIGRSISGCRVRFSLLLTSETPGYVEFHPSIGGEFIDHPTHTVRLHYDRGKNVLNHSLVVPAQVEGYRLHLPSAFGRKTVWGEELRIDKE